MGAGQTSWQTPHPVQTSATTIGMPFSTFIAPGTGQRSEQTVQKELYARQKRPWMTATFAIASVAAAESALLTGTGFSRGVGAGSTVARNVRPKIENRLRLERPELIPFGPSIDDARFPNRN